jgi:predicted double-glycine peptidase
MIDKDRRKYEHYVVIKGIVNSYLHINDPYYGRRRVKINNFVAQRGNLFWKKRVQWGMVVSKRF